MNEIEPSARVSPLADIEHSTRGSKLALGAGCVVDSFVKIKFAGGTGDVLIGPRCYINSGTVIYSGNGVTIGADVLIAANCTLAPTNHEFGSRDIPVARQGFQSSRGGIRIEDDVWVGAGSVLLDGAVLRRGCVIAAGAVVRDEVAAFSIVVGAPARQIGMRGPR